MRGFDSSMGLRPSGRATGMPERAVDNGHLQSVKEQAMVS
jgi:hypothetical protein